MTEEKNRVKERNSAIWTKLINLNYMGINNYLEHWEEDINNKNRHAIRFSFRKFFCFDRFR